MQQRGARAIEIDFLRQDRAGADKAEVAANDIENLRQLIERCFAEEFAKAGNARIVGYFVMFAVFGGQIGAVHIFKLQASIFFTVLGAHGAEFVQGNGLGELA